MALTAFLKHPVAALRAEGLNRTHGAFTTRAGNRQGKAAFNAKLGVVFVLCTTLSATHRQKVLFALKSKNLSAKNKRRCSKTR
jgi:hypothetical protein